MTFGVCDFSRLAFTDWRLRCWRLCFLALMTATRISQIAKIISIEVFLLGHRAEQTRKERARGWKGCEENELSLIIFCLSLS